MNYIYWWCKHSLYYNFPFVLSSFSHFLPSLIILYFIDIGLNNTDVIGDVGSRSFYLRKSNSSNASYQEIALEIAPVKANSHPLVISHGFFGRKINKIIRRSCKLWKILGCMQCSGWHNITTTQVNPEFYTSVWLICTTIRW